MRPIVTAAVAVLLATSAGGAFAASAVQKECSAKYQAAKSGGTLNGMTYNQFYSQCAKEAREGGATPAPTPAATSSAPVQPSAAAPASTSNTAAAKAVFPSAVSPEFAKETPGKARMHTCLAQYKANKSSNGNAGLKWIERGGGYYSECNKRLKS